MDQAAVEYGKKREVVEDDFVHGAEEQEGDRATILGNALDIIAESKAENEIARKLRGKK